MCECEWRGMESAPKDGRWLMLHGDGSGFGRCPFIGYYGVRTGYATDKPAWRLSFDYGRSLSC